MSTQAEGQAPLVVEFSVGKSIHDALENGEPLSQDIIDEGIACLERAAAIVRAEGLFSPNEELDDINTQDLKYLLIPYYLSQLHQQNRDPTTRLNSVRLGLRIQLQFLAECRKRQLMSAQDEKSFERDGDDAPPNPAEIREEKIARFKMQKSLSDKLQSIISRQQDAGIDADDQERDFVIALLRLCISRALDGLRTIRQEIQILDRMPPPKPTPKDLAKRDARQAARKTDDDTATRVGTDGLGSGWDVRSRERVRVFSYGLTRPTMTLEEFAKVEMDIVLKRQERQKASEAERAKIDPDSEEGVDAKTLKDRYWDNFKDDNPKGSGNTGLKSTFDVAAFQQENPTFKKL